MLFENHNNDKKYSHLPCGFIPHEFNIGHIFSHLMKGIDEKRFGHIGLHLEKELWNLQFKMETKIKA